MKVLHLVFGISSCVLLIATLWLLAADHNREYKQYQKDFEGLTTWQAESRLAEFETVKFTQEQDRLHETLVAAGQVAPDPLYVDRFAAQLLYAQLAKTITAEEKAKLDELFLPLAKGGLDELPESAKLLADVLAKLQEMASGNPAVARLLAENKKSQELAQAAAAGDEKASKKVTECREELFAIMRGQISLVQFDEGKAALAKKFRSAQLDEAKSKLDLAVRDGKSAETLHELEAGVDKVMTGGDDKADPTSVAAHARGVEAANLQRSILESILSYLTADEALAAKNLDAHLANPKALADSMPQAIGKLIDFPIIDAFGGPLKPKQVWLPNLKIATGSFGEIARFDRCVSCHLGIDRTAPGSADQPALPAQESLTFFLAVPEEQPEPLVDEEGNALPLDLHTLYGLRLADRGWADSNDVSVLVVAPGKAGARAGLKIGDAISYIRVGDRDEKINTNADALRFLVQEVTWGRPIEVTVRRGVQQPFASHPRLDLFVGSLSPHKIGDMGCTICHEGQGSATAFKWTSHTPNTPEQAHEWSRDHGYFNNHHWIFPMRPNRFVESSCLKCHHEVEQLAPSERFPEDPAPKLVEGYDQIRNFGCYGCHEINGFNGPDKRMGPDLRNEPPYFAAAAQLGYQMGVRQALLEGVLQGSDDEDAQAALEAGLKMLAEIGELSKQVAHHPEDDAAREHLYTLVQGDAERSTAAKMLLSDPGLTGEMRSLASRLNKTPDRVSFEDRQSLVEFLREDQEQAEPTLRPDATPLAELLSAPSVLTKDSHKVGELLKAVESPGSLRRPGPSLRHVASKLGGDTLYRWIYDPRSIRPTTKMPRFFGHHGEYDYLTDKSAAVADRLETIEAYTAAAYLLNKSQPFDYLPVQEGVTEEPDFERGRVMFQSKGCLACHKHDEDSSDSDELLGHSDQGPNLSDLGKKLRAEKGKQWLHSWILKPNHYNLRTRMPDVLLDPEPMLDAESKPILKDGKVAKYDPAADIVEFLLGEAWQADADELAPLTAEQQTHLDELVHEYLKGSFSEARADEYLKSGIPEKVASRLVGHEVELAMVPADASSLSHEQRAAELLDKKLIYVGRRTIGKLGCVGCHDIPGLEAEKPIGTTLADWGRKESSKLAFEHITEYLGEQQAAFGDSHGSHGDEGSHGGHEHLDPAKWEKWLSGVQKGEPRDEGYYIAAMHHHEREGFLWQKLREPRSYDYHKTETKVYNDRLRMPLFNWDKASDGELTAEGRHQVESVMTFVLGLVAEPPAAEYVFKGDEREQAIVAGEKVLARFNCAGCHAMTLDRWDIAFDPAVHDFEASEIDSGYTFVQPSTTSDELFASLHADVAGRRHATLRGMPQLNAAGKVDELIYLAEDEEFLPASDLEEGDFNETTPRATAVELWEPAVINGGVFDVRAPLPPIADEIVQRHVPGRGGEFARFLIPVALAMENSEGGSEAWAWVPPPLIDQGNKTQSEWLHDFLLDPQLIRPAVVLRMPKFNMSSDEATALVHYFAARDNSDYPHQFNYRTRRDHLESREEAYQEKLTAEGLDGTRFEGAFEIIVNNGGCVKCHLVSDFDPGGTPRAKGPDLTEVNRRMQPEYLKRWIAKPDSILPYTKMPVNFPYGDAGFVQVDPASGETRQLYHGDSTQQIEGVVDLLMNLESYLERQVSIKSQVESAPATDTAPAVEN